MIKEFVLAGVISIVGGQTNLLTDSITPNSPSAYGSKEIEIDGPGPIVTLNERFTYSVDSYTFINNNGNMYTFRNSRPTTISRNFTIAVPGDTFQVVSYSSIVNNALKLATVKDLVNAEYLDPSDTYVYSNIEVAPGQVVMYGFEKEMLTLRIKEVREARYWSWGSWSNYNLESTLYFDVIHTNYMPFLW